MGINIFYQNRDNKIGRDKEKVCLRLGLNTSIYIEIDFSELN